MRLGTWNIRTLTVPGACDILSDELDKYSMDVVALQEIRWPMAGKVNTKNYTIYYSGCDEERYYGGVGFAVRNELINSVIYFEAVNERMCNIRFKGKYKNISLISIYAPTEVADEEDKDLFYGMLEEQINKLPGYDMKIILGDANAKVGKETVWKSVAGGQSLHDNTNDNGTRLGSLASATNLFIVSTMHPRKEIHKQTWISPDGRTKNQIDHVLVDRRNLSSISKVRSIRGAECGSDHYLVLIGLKQRIAVIRRNKPKQSRAIAVDKLKDKKVAEEFKIKLSNRFEGLRDADESSDYQPDIESEWAYFKKSILEVAVEVCGESSKQKKNPWFDDECRQAVGKRNEEKAKWLVNKTNEAKKELNEACKRTNRLLRWKKRSFLNGLMEKAERNQIANNARDFYRSIQFFKKGSKPNTYGVKSKNGNIIVQDQEMIERWREYFRDLLNGEEMNVDEADTNIKYQHVQPLVEPPTKEEVRFALRALKNNKAPGVDGIPAELLKKGSDIVEEKMHRLIKEVWEQGAIPREWREAIIVPIYKKGEKENCENYRGISLLSHSYKVLSRIILRRLEEYTDSIIEDHQAGFTKGRSTTDQIYILKQALSRYWEYGKDVHVIFVDFQKAYDSLYRAKIWEKLEQFGIPHKLIEMVKICTEESVCRVKMNANISEPFEVNTGVKQGDGLSPLLFNLALEDTLKQVRKEEAGLDVGVKFNILAFADDIVVVAEKKDDLKKLMDILVQEAELMGLKVNDEKTKYMHLTRNRGMGNASFCIGQHTFDQVSDFKYLGVIITEDNAGTPEILNRINLASRCSFACNKLLSSKILSRKTKLKIYHSIIRPVLMYGAETWTISKAMEKKIVTFENKILRKIYGPTQENGEWRIKHNKEIRDLYNDSDAVAIIKSRRIRWAGHIQRRDPERILRRIGEGQPAGRRPRGRPRIRWWDQVQSDITTIGADLGEAEDRESWRGRVAEAKSLLGYKWPWE